jgi:hypothetical protein
LLNDPTNPGKLWSSCGRRVVVVWLSCGCRGCRVVVVWLSCGRRGRRGRRVVVVWSSWSCVPWSCVPWSCVPWSCVCVVSVWSCVVCRALKFC